jgi:tetratricopeptide (TPR) repeat protein
MIKSYALEQPDPSDRYTWYLKALLFDELGHPNEAVECYDRTLEIDPDYYKHLKLTKVMHFIV